MTECNGLKNGYMSTGKMTNIEKQIETHFVVAAIDFGTTYSGYAFSFLRDQADSIHMMRKWEGGDPGVNNQKTATTLLLKPNGDFHSFGFGARDFYHDLEAIEAKKWYYFEKFKMNLHSSQASLGCFVAKKPYTGCFVACKSSHTFLVPYVHKYTLIMMCVIDV